MSNNNAGGLLANPLPIVMVVLLAAGVLIKHEELKSARPNDSERAKFLPAGQQDVEARLWQDPFAAVEKHEERSKPTMQTSEKRQQVIDETPNAGGQIKVTTVSQKSGGNPQPDAHTSDQLLNQIQKIREAGGEVKVIAVSVFGGPYAEAAESRRRTRFAVLAALGFYGYSPTTSDAIGYFRIRLPDNHENVLPLDSERPGFDFKLVGPAGSAMLAELTRDTSNADTVDLNVPYEWFEQRNPWSNVLLLWLNENKLTVGSVAKLRSLERALTPQPSNNQSIVGTGLTRDLSERSRKSRLEVFVPTATITSCDLYEPISSLPWNCFMMEPPLLLNDMMRFPAIRTIGTDDVLAAALLWELWQRGVNRAIVESDSLSTPTSANASTRHNPASFARKCTDGLVLISEWDSAYARALSRNLSAGFSESCTANGTPSRPVRSFTYLRGLDGMLPDVDKVSANAPRKDDNGKAKDLRAQLEEAPPERAEGRSQYDYLRRLGDEIARLDGDTQFAVNGVKAIGIVGSDVYDKLLILQALRMRFKDKIFFTTDLDARYLHADQKRWARNLVLASNFDLSLHPVLQKSAPPFRDGYQTATYLATLMALETKAFDSWTGKVKDWLRPQIFEIGRTGPVYLASPSVDDLTKWIKSGYSDGSAPPSPRTICDDEWLTCKNIEPERPPRGLSNRHLLSIISMIFFGILSLSLVSRRVQQTVRDALTSIPPAEALAARLWLIGAAVLVLTVIGTILGINWAMNAQGGEPFVWLEGVSVWPSIVLRFVGFVTIIALVVGFTIWIRRQAHLISKDFELPMPRTWTLARSRWSALLTGPHLDLASFGPDGSVVEKAADTPVEIASLWQNYLRLTSWREKTWWILASTAIVSLLGFVPYYLFGSPSFPHRGQLVEMLYRILEHLNGPFLWLVIFWVGYEIRACARFVTILSDVTSVWPKSLLDREETKTGVPRAHLDDHLDFQLIVLATRRIHWLIYLPFVLLVFLVLARSSIFDAMDFPLTLVFVTGLALAYAVYTAVLLRRSAEAARAKALAHYDARLLAQARPKDSPPAATANAVAANPTPISAEQIKLLMERIRNTREGAFAPFTQQPALQALLLPFGGYGGVQLVEYLINL